MKIFDWFKMSNDIELGELTQHEFDISLQSLLQHDSLEAEEVIADMVKRGVKEDIATELYLLVPVAFCRRFIPQAAYSDEYVDYYGDRGEIKRTFKRNKFYCQIGSYTNAYFEQNPQREFILSIAGVSAEFKIINNMINNGSKIDDLLFSPLYIVR